MDARRSVPLLGWAGLLWAGYCALAYLGLQAFNPADQAATLWPAAGLALGAFAVAPRRAWPVLGLAVMAGSLAAQLLVVDAPLWVELAMAANALVQAVLGALLLRALAGRGGPRSGALRTVGGLFVAAAAASVVGAVGSNLALHLW